MNRGLSLVDVLAAALQREDERCGPPVVALTWAGPLWLRLTPSDVQRSAEREPAGRPRPPVILGTLAGPR